MEKNKKVFRSPRFRHGGAAVLLSAVFIGIVILVNVVFTLLEERFPSMQIDMTADRIYSLSEEALDAAEAVEIPVRIYILASEETAKDDSLMAAYGLPYSQVAVLAERMQEKNSNIQVEYIDLDRNPTFLSNERYTNLSLETGSVLVESDRRTRALGKNDLFGYQVDPSTGQVSYYMQVDSAMTAALLQVTAKEVPVFSISVGSHEEMLSPSINVLRDLLKQNQFEVVDFDLMKEEIPEGTQILMLPTPVTDLTQAELDKLDAYLAAGAAGNHTLWVTFHPTQPPLANLAQFMAEWGFDIPTSVIGETDGSRLVAPDAMYLISDVSEEIDLGGTGIYDMLVTPMSRPIGLNFESNAGRVTDWLARSSQTCYLQGVGSGVDESAGAKLGSANTIAMSYEVNQVDGTNYWKRIVAFGSSVMFTDNYLAGGTFANAGYLVDLAHFVTGTGDRAVPVQMNRVENVRYDITVPMTTRFTLGIGVFTILMPLLVLVFGGIVYFRRRRL